MSECRYNAHLKAYYILYWLDWHKINSKNEGGNWHMFSRNLSPRTWGCTKVQYNFALPKKFIFLVQLH